MKKDLFNFEKEVLDNGLEIFYKKGKGSETEVRLLLKTGGDRYDPIGKEDCAHTLEHLLFKKTRLFPNELALHRFALNHLLNFGARTDYESICIRGYSPLTVKPLFVLLNEVLNPQLEEDNLEKEKLIIAREMNQFEIVEKLVEMREKTAKALYGDHPYGKRGIEIGKPCGKLWTMKFLTINDLKKHYQKFFVSKNAALIIITPNSLNDVKSYAEKFISLSQGSAIKSCKPLKSFPKPNENFLSFSWSERIESRKKEEAGDIVEFFAVIPAIEVVQGWSVIYRILYEILKRSLRLKKSWAYTVSIEAHNAPDITTIKISTNVTSGKGNKTKDLFFKEISRFEKNRQLFNLFKKKKLIELKNYQALPEDIADIVCKDIVTCNKPITIKEVIKEIESFSFKQAVELIDKWLNEDRVLVRIITP